MCPISVRVAKFNGMLCPIFVEVDVFRPFGTTGGCLGADPPPGA